MNPQSRVHGPTSLRAGRAAPGVCRSWHRKPISSATHTLTQDPLHSPWISRIFKGWPPKPCITQLERDGHSEAAHRSEQLRGFPRRALPTWEWGSGSGTLGRPVRPRGSLEGDPPSHRGPRERVGLPEEKHCQGEMLASSSGKKNKTVKWGGAS